MATLFGQEVSGGGEGKHASPSIVDDFMYSSNVASSHVYIRMAFLRKVYGILSAQILLTTLVSIIFMSFEPVANFVKESQWLLMASVFTSFGLLIALMVKKKDVPANYILLGCFTLIESVMVGVVVTFYTVPSVIQAFALTCAVTLALTFYTFQSKRDMSSWGAGLFSCLWILIIAGFMQIFLQSEIVDLAIAVGGAALFSVFIIFDTHMIMHRVSPEDYIEAAIDLYLDILNLFLYILRILGERKN